MNSKCLVIGDLNTDLIISDLNGYPELGKEILAKNYFFTIGGSGGIFTAVLSNLGIQTSIISKIGNDYFGNFLFTEIKRYGVDTDSIIIQDGEETGLTVSLSYEKGKSQISKLDLIKSMKLDEITIDNFENLRHVHFSSYYMMDSLKKSYVELIKKIKKKFYNITFSLDTNDDPEDKWGEEIYDTIKNIDILFLNKKEVLKISNENKVQGAIEKLSKFVDKVVVKMGKEGYLAKINKKYFKGECINKLNKNFKDGTGAGDNFNAGFIYGFLNNFKPNKTLEFANFCGEKSIEFFGGLGPVERFRQLKELIKR
ncbi:MAG: carbohydrate kinase family protein [Actinobacteria bacterium]|nr:carbohydrate kinase family protein [Actinomycetota bacterium]MCL5771592.1 carbohydrate kinase family protein [Actinomycetota bacterium]